MISHRLDLLCSSTKTTRPQISAPILGAGVGLVVSLATMLADRYAFLRVCLHTRRIHGSARLSIMFLCVLQVP